jgi:hypothetical protein
MRRRNFLHRRTVCWLAVAGAAYLGGFYIGASAEDRKLRPFMVATQELSDLTKRGIEFTRQMLAEVREPPRDYGSTAGGNHGGTDPP